MWERFKGKYSDLVTVLEKAIAAVSEGTFDEALRQQAYKEAHTLVGSLGSFGLLEASRLCREIEQAFQVEQILTQVQVEQVSELVVALRQELGEPSRGAEELLRTRGKNTHAPLATSQKQQLCLLIFDDAQLTQALILQAKARGIQAEAVKELSAAREVLARIRPDVVLLDLCCDSFDTSATKAGVIQGHNSSNVILTSYSAPMKCFLEKKVLHGRFTLALLNLFALVCVSWMSYHCMGLRETVNY